MLMPADSGPSSPLSLDVVLAALRGWEPEDGPDPEQAAIQAGAAMRAALAECGAWDTIPAGHRAAVLAAEAESSYRTDRRQLIALLDHTILVCRGESPSRWGYARELARAEEILGRLDRMPSGWRVEVVRQVLAELTAAVSGAQQARNRLRSRGIDPDGEPTTEGTPTP